MSPAPPTGTGVAVLRREAPTSGPRPPTSATTESVRERVEEAVAAAQAEGDGS